jgi:hypothetical protein
MKTYEEVAKKHDLPLDTAERFIMYMRRRWGNPEDEAVKCQVGYASEWADRFLYMLEYSASDSEGQRILRAIDSR